MSAVLKENKEQITPMGEDKEKWFSGGYQDGWNDFRQELLNIINN
jgi:hypothetical protein